MKETIMVAVISALTSGGCLAFVQFLIDRSDKKKDKESGVGAAIAEVKKKIESMEMDLKEKMKKNEKDNLRTQLLVMIIWRPEEKKEILTLGERYFKELHGNWYMTSIFNKWLEDQQVAEPEWFDNN